MPEPTLLYMPYKLHRWKDTTTNLLPMAMGDPVPHCIGFIPVFDDEAAAKEWADGRPVGTMIVQVYDA